MKINQNRAKLIETGLFNIKHKEFHKLESIETERFPNFEFSDLEMQVIGSDVAIPYISTHHYSKTCTRSISIAFGFYYNKELVGCVVYANPVGSMVVQSLAKALELTPYNVYELTRLFTDDRLPNNSESYCIGKTIKYIKQNLKDVYYLVSYADTMYGHSGCIYQATNWLFTGTVEPKATYKIRGRMYHARTLHDIYGSSSIPYLKELLGDDLEVSYSVCKNRYVYVLGSSKSEHKLLMNELSYPILPYPKQDIEYYRME